MVQIAAAMTSSTSSTQRNHDCPDGHGPVVIMCPQ